MMGIGSKTVLAAAGLCVLGAIQQKWMECDESVSFQGSSFVCLVKNSGQLLKDQVKSLVRPQR